MRPAASPEEIRTAHKALVWLLDPARQNSPEERQAAKQKVQRVEAMAATLLDPQARRTYDAGLARAREAGAPSATRDPITN